MKHNRPPYFLLISAVLGLVALSACRPATPVPLTPTTAPAPTPTSAPVPSPTAAPVGVQELVLSTVASQEAGIQSLQAGQIDIYAETVSNPQLFKTVRSDAKLGYNLAWGAYTELTFNPVLNFKDGRLNPFGDPQIREAMNWLIDRNYIAQEIYGGLATPKWLPLSSAFPDYARYVDVARALERQYAHNPDKAKQVIADRMKALGATLGPDGKWLYKGKPVTLIFIIRTEDERKAIGDYVAGLLEQVGFTVDRQYKTRKEASPIWVRSDPAEGKWHLYTGGWINTAISRDDSTVFADFYTPQTSALAGTPLAAAYKPSPEFLDVATKLQNRQYRTLEERAQLFRRAMELALKDSVRVWLVDQQSFNARKADLTAAYDLAGGIGGSRLVPYTLRWLKNPAPQVRIAFNGILIDPYNPVAGSNWVSDAFAYRATSDPAAMPDPYTGLYWPQRLERAEVVVREGLPVTRTLDWVSLQTAKEIQVPADAWVDWDAKAQRFVRASERYTQPVSVQAKVTVYYPADLFQKVKWHDGSPLSLGDFILNMILTFDRAKPDSPIYDESYVPSFESFMQRFKGVRIVSTNPLVIESYVDAFELDAEVLAAGWTWFPDYGSGPGPWHTLALGIRAEAEKKLTFSSDKAEKLKVEWMNMVAGPSLDVLKATLNQAAQEGYLPYAPTMGEYVKTEEIQSRYANLKKWVEAHNHFWVGMGPFYLDKVFPTEKTVSLKRFADFPDPAEKWARFSEPRLASVSVEGPSQVTAGSEATFEVSVKEKDRPYPAAEVQSVRYLVFDAQGQVAASGQAAPVAEGRYQVRLTGDVTQKLGAGSNRLEVIVTVKPVSLPAFASLEFISTK
ncbi:ABC transporter substrate-binding protein [Thermoflexus sp.]|uniref:ABC transporter substrate-binding protein n=1 Tax=Thermoflexus sp. TaxID=1969742 RepID=UPI0035E45A80